MREGLDEGIAASILQKPFFEPSNPENSKEGTPLAQVSKYSTSCPATDVGACARVPPNRSSSTAQGKLDNKVRAVFVHFDFQPQIALLEGKLGLGCAPAVCTNDS